MIQAGDTLVTDKKGISLENFFAEGGRGKDKLMGMIKKSSGRVA